MPDKRKKKSTKERALHRTKIIKGHVEAIEKMIESDAYCIDIVHQSQAVQNALQSLNELILQDHFETCVVNDIREGNEGKAINEVMELFRYKRSSS